MASESGEVTLAVFGAPKVGKSGMYMFEECYLSVYSWLTCSMGKCYPICGRCNILNVNIVYRFIYVFIIARHIFVAIWFSTDNWGLVCRASFNTRASVFHRIKYL